jgi:ribulose-bisphosphate carboxylase large chain
MNRQKEYSENRFSVHYRIIVNDGRTIEQHAEDITVEQTVEMPVGSIPREIIPCGILGRVESIAPVGNTRSTGVGGVHDVVISYRSDLTEGTAPQLLNVVFGNISLKNNICITGFDWDKRFLSHFSGPAHGIEGMRKITGVFGRPLACTALKPIGLSIEKLAKMAAASARGGVDLIKDDHGLSNQDFHPFRERVARCQEAVSHENARSGRNTVYCPMVSGRFDEIDGQVRYALQQGVQGILIAPMLVGFDTVRYLSETYKVAIIAHPALTGTFFNTPAHGMTPATLLGSIFRLIGADISVFPNYGGRFFFTKSQCLDLAGSLRGPLDPLKPAFPCPAGGMSMERIKDLAQDYGEEAVFLIGGALLKRSADLAEAFRLFMDAIRRHFHERLEEPDFGFHSSCEAKAPAAHAVADVLKCEGFQWSQFGRKPEAYKAEGGFDFKGVTRQELMGKFGEKTSFDLRYFEIGPSGHSSLEKHVHEHVIIGARGRGVLVKNSTEIPISINDVAYVGPLEVHQLRNETSEPFGFFCIVDHVRDKPMAP